MSTEPVDYTAILADLEAKKAALEQTIASFRQAMAAGALGQTSSDTLVPSLAAPSVTGGEVPAGAFHNKSIPEATRLYLEIVNKKQNTRDIAEALLKGGMESTRPKNFVNIVLAGLNRARKSPASGIVKLGSQWGLASWYPKGIIAAATAAPPKKTKRKSRTATSTKTDSATKKTARATGPQAVPPAAPVISADRNPAERVLEILRVNSGTAFTTQELAKMLKLDPSRVALILGNLTRGRKVEKNKDGKYVAVTSMGAAV
jgi:hypothetical protein